MEFALSTDVRSGSVRTNILELRKMVTEEMSKYHEIVVTEDNLKGIKDTLAKLRAFEKQAKAAFKSAQDEYDEPVRMAKADFDGILQIVKDAEDALDVQVKEIEAKQKEQRIGRCMDIMAEVFEHESESVVAFASRCLGWIQKKEWGNKTYTEKQVREDILKSLDDIRLALDSFTGEFSNQQLADFAEYGDYQKAFRLGQKLQRDKSQMESIQKAREEELAKQNAEQEQRIVIGRVPEGVSNPMSQVSQSIEPMERKHEPSELGSVPGTAMDMSFNDAGPMTDVFPAVESFIVDEASKKRCVGHFEVRGPRYAIQWLLEMAKMGGLEMTKEVRNG